MPKAETALSADATLQAAPALTGSDVADRPLLSNMMALTGGELPLASSPCRNTNSALYPQPFFRLASISGHELTMSSDSQFLAPDSLSPEPSQQTSALSANL